MLKLTGKIGDSTQYLVEQFVYSLKVEDFNDLKFIEQTLLFKEENNVFVISTDSYNKLINSINKQLTEAVLKDLKSTSISEEDLLNSLNQFLTVSFSKVKLELVTEINRNLSDEYIKQALKVIKQLKLRLPKEAIEDVKKELYIVEILTSDFDFSKVWLGNTENDYVRGFSNYINYNVPKILHKYRKLKTPNDLVLKAIDTYYLSLKESERNRLASILTKNNYEVLIGFQNNEQKVSDRNYTLKYTSSVADDVLFYQTPYGFWGVRFPDGSEPKVFTVYTITNSSIKECIQKATAISNKFKLGQTPIWVANKMYLRK